MALCILVCLGFIVTPGNLSAQEWQFVTGEYLGTALDGAGRILVVGEHGIVMRSEDDGGTWELAHSGTYHTLRDVAFIGGDRAFVVGDSGLVLRSDDAGATWRRVNIGASGSLRVIAPAGEVIAVAGDNRLFRSVDRGEGWGESLLPDTASDLVFSGAGVGVMVSERGVIYRTTDTGNTWIPVYTNPELPLHAVGFSPDGTFGVAAGEGRGGEENSRIVTTRDGGATWGEAEAEGLLLETNSIAVGEEGNVVAGGAMQRGTNDVLFVSRDSGLSWNAVELLRGQGSEAVMSVVMRGERGMAGTNIGMIAGTEDGWRSFDTVTDTRHVHPGLGPTIFTSGIIAADNSGVLANGSAPGGLGVTTDGGIRWRLKKYGTSFWRSLQLLGAGDIGLFGALPDEIYRTSDGGKSWSHISTEHNPVVGCQVSRVQTFGAHNIYQLCNGELEGDRYGVFYYSSDSGRHFRGEVWREFQRYGILDFVSPRVGIIGGYTLPDDADSASQGYGHGGLFLTEDAGESRKMIYEFSGIENVSAWVGRTVDTNRVLLAMGGGVHGYPGKHVLLETTDKGESWHVNHVFDYQIYDLAVFNDSVWCAVGEQASIQLTTDRGKTWLQEKIEPLPQIGGGVPRFRQIILLPDKRTAMIFGDGVILRKVFPERLSGVEEGGAEVASSERLEVFPNPAGDRLRIRWRGEGGSTRLRFYDLLGRQVLPDAVIREGEEKEISLSGLPSGVYRVVGVDEGGTMRISRAVMVE